MNLTLKLFYALFSCSLLFAHFGCAKKSMSERDIRREQLRLNAHKKRQEMAPLAGNYRGSMTTPAGYKQDVSLHLELKDIPESEGGKVDPVLVPTVVGAMSLTYGSGAGLEMFSFATSKADFNAADSRLDLVATNTLFKEMNLSLRFGGENLAGTWSSSSTSQSGELSLKKTLDLTLGGETRALNGTYPGIFEWNDAPYFARGSLALTTARDGVDSFHITASMKVMIPSVSSTETFIYEYENVEFNPFTRQLSLRSETSDVYFTGQMDQSEVRGTWHSKRIGLLGSAKFSMGDFSLPADKNPTPAASGSWYGTIVNIRPSTQLPPRMMLNFSTVPDKDQPGGVKLVGSTRFYYGSFSSNEYLEYRFDSVDYQPFSRRVVALNQGSTKITVQFDMEASGISGVIIDPSLGEVATFTAGRQLPAESGNSVAGDYNGIFTYENTTSLAYQEAKLNLVPSFDGTGFKLSASATLFFADERSGEALVYRFDDSQFNSVTGLLTLANNSSDIVIKATVTGSGINGEWFSTSLGRMGKVSLTKSAPPAPPENAVRFPTLKGTYKGSIKNTSSASNLAERILFGMITNLDPSSPRGLKITGNVRLYLGSFESAEFVELPFDSLEIDPYRRTITGKTSGALKLTIQGTISPAGDITGTISDDSLGFIATFEVAKYVEL